MCAGELRSEEGDRSSGDRVMGSCQLPHVGAEKQTHNPKRAQAP